jgi:putative transposase
VTCVKITTITGGKMGITKTQKTAKSKSKIALEALKGDQTISEIASKNSVHPTQVTRWKKQLEVGMIEIFEKGPVKEKKASINRESELFEEIGRLKFELDWLKKKKLPTSTEIRRLLIDESGADISVRRQCELIGLHRSGLYYTPSLESEENLVIMKMLDKQYM